eukprot:403367_1
MVISINMVNVLQFIISWFIIFIICWFNFLSIFVHSQTRNGATQVHQHTYLNRYTYIKLNGRKKFMYEYSSFNIICIYTLTWHYFIQIKLLYMLSYLLLPNTLNIYYKQMNLIQNKVIKNLKNKKLNYFLMANQCGIPLGLFQQIVFGITDLLRYFTNAQWINVNLKDNMEWLYTFNLNHYKCAVIRIHALSHISTLQF